jgi:aryl-alcohol dehydrogenase-like predicted oxidoreductase
MRPLHHIPPATNGVERRVPQFHPTPTADLHATFSEVDYTTGFVAVEELRKPMPLGVSMSQFILRWILMFDAHTCAILGGKRADRLRTTPMLASSAY